VLKTLLRCPAAWSPRNHWQLDPADRNSEAIIHDMQYTLRPTLIVSSAGLLAAALSLSGCGNGDPPPDPNPSFDFSFEDSLADWTPRAYDIEVGGEEVDWSIATSTDRATDGGKSARFYVDNRTDAAKIFLERGFELAPGSYDVSLAFDFATQDYGDVNLWSLIAGVGTIPVASPEDLNFWSDTGNGTASDNSYHWLSKAPTGTDLGTVSVTVAAGQKAYVHLGVWGTWESPKTYYIDKLVVSFTRKP
jgi:hypothetical protein